MRAPLAPTPSLLPLSRPLLLPQSRFLSPLPSPSLFSCEKVVEIESDEDSTEGPISKMLRPTTTASHSSTVDRSTTPRDRTSSAPSFPDLFDGGTSASVTPPALELPTVLQHALRGFQLEVTVDSDEAATRERLGFNFGALLAHSNALITRLEARVALVGAKTKEETALLAHKFVARETAPKQELACLRRSEKDLSKQLHVKCQEVVELEARILPVRIRVFELEEAAEASKAKMAGLEKRSINQEVQLGCVEVELLQQAKRFEEAEVELTGDGVDAYDAGFEDALAQVACVHPEMDASPFAVSNRVVNEQIVMRILP